MKSKRVIFILISLLVATILFKSILTYSKQTEVESILKKIGSFENYKKIMEEAIKRNPYSGETGYDRWLYFGDEIPIISKPGVYTQQAQEETAEKSVHTYSQTNVQMQDVDEADIVKTDGKYIYILRPSKNKVDKEILIIKSYPADKMEIIKRLNFTGDLKPVEFYIDNKYLIVICEKNTVVIRPYIKIDPNTNKDTNTRKPLFIEILENKTISIIYDISDKSNPNEIRRVTFDGRYVNSRKIGLNLYIVTRKLFQYDLYISKKYTEKDFMPYYCDSKYNNSQRIYIGFDKISYLPDFKDNNIALVGSFNIESGSVSVECVLGGSGTVYSSKGNLYLCSELGKKIFWGLITEDGFNPRYIYIEKTAVLKFELNGAKAMLKAAGVLNGNVLNQFSMDEYNGYFRIAITGERPSLFRATFDTFNAVYILDKNLKVVG